MEHLVVIGNGIAGITTARHVRKRSDMKITVVSNETDHFFSRTALMYIYMGHMAYEHTKPYEDGFWEKNRIGLLRATALQIDTRNKEVVLDSGKRLAFSHLLIATGSKTNKFGWPGQDLPGVQGLYSYQDLQLLEKNTQNISSAVIVGGGLIGIELAEMLVSRDISVTFLVREQEYWDNVLPKEEAAMISRHIREHGIGLRLQTNLKEILPGPDGRARVAVTEFGEEIPCQLVGLTPGVHPNIDLVRDSEIETGRGILVNDYLETNIANVYAAGDCVEIKTPGEARNRFEQLWYTGRMHGQTLASTICGVRTAYERGIWFNSAKFIEIEYQTYGFVSNVPREGESSFYWEDDGGHHGIRLVYQTDSDAVTGMNFFGIRMRQETCQQWIAEKRSVDYVIQHLPEANFDPEFFRRYEPAILAKFNQARGSSLQLQAPLGFFTRFFWT